MWGLKQISYESSFYHLWNEDNDSCPIFSRIIIRMTASSNLQILQSISISFNSSQFCSPLIFLDALTIPSSLFFHFFFYSKGWGEYWGWAPGHGQNLVLTLFAGIPLSMAWGTMGTRQVPYFYFSRLPSFPFFIPPILSPALFIFFFIFIYFLFWSHTWLLLAQ